MGTRVFCLSIFFSVGTNKHDRSQAERTVMRLLSYQAMTNAGYFTDQTPHLCATTYVNFNFSEKRLLLLVKSHFLLFREDFQSLEVPNTCFCRSDTSFQY